MAYQTYREYLAEKIYQLSNTDISFFMFMEKYLDVIQDNVYPGQVKKICQVMTEYFESHLNKEGKFEIN